MPYIARVVRLLFRMFLKRFYSNFKLGKLNHIAIATREAHSHLNFFGKVLKAEIGDKLVMKTF
jgi:hypothetical protein